MTDKAYAVPLHEQLARVPREARLVIEDSDGMGISYIPVGRMCHEAAEALRATPQREWQGLTDEEIKSAASLGIYEKPLIDFARAIEAKLKEKNNG